MKNYILLLLLAAVAGATVAKPIDVNKTAILVEDTVANDPIKIKQAFAQILANNTGEDITVILQHPEFVTANIRSGIKHSYFEKIEARYLPEQSPHKYWFYLVMQQDYVHGLIKRAGFSILPHKRENIMLWVVKDEMVSDEIITDIQLNELVYAYRNEITMYWIKHWAEALNVSLTYPSMDEDDMLLVSPASIKTLSFEATEQSKNKYNTDHSVLLYITNIDEAIKLRSGIVIANNDMIINHYQQDLIPEGELMYSMMLDISNSYANAYKVGAIDLENHTVQMVIDSIDNYNELVYIEKYIANLSIVQSYDIFSVSRDKLTLAVNLSITTQAFLKILARDMLLIYHQDSAINQLKFSSSE